MDDEMIGKVLAGHRIDELVGRGGMGTVFRATDLTLERVTAIKVIHPALAGDPGFRTRFVTECRLAAAVDHPNVVDIFQAGEHDGVLFVAMRFVDGHDLRTLLAHAGALEPERAVRIATQVAAALDAAHARDLIHRDVKPGNVLLGVDDSVFLTDFGISVRLATETDDTAPAGMVVGTLNYAAPEQLAGGAGPGSDVYSLGCMVYEMLSGSVPFPVRGYEAKVLAHRSSRPAALASALDPVVQRALRKDPGDRQPSAGAFARELQAALLPRTDGARAPRRPLLRVRAPGGKAVRGLDPELATLVTEATATLRRIKGGAPLRDAIIDAAHAAQRDLDELARNPPAQLRERLRTELLRGQSSRLVDGLKSQLLAMQDAERRCTALRQELQRQVVELDRLLIVDEREVAERVAVLRRDLEGVTR